MMRLMTPTNSLLRPIIFSRFTAFEKPQMALLTQASYFNFASRMAQKRIYVDKKKVHVPSKTSSTLSFRKPWDPTARPMKLKITKVTKRATFTRQPTPIHDYIKFKNMSGNEILINLNNVSNLGQQEMMGGLIELSRRDKKREHDWNVNPITAKCIQVYNDKVKGYNSKRVMQGLLMLHMLRIHNLDAWS